MLFRQFSLAGCRWPVGRLCVLLQRRTGSRAKPQAAAHAALPEVTVAEVIHRPLREWQEFSGRLQAVNTVDVRPRVSGYVDRVAFTDGARVKKGQLLFQIDPRPFQAEVDRLIAERSAQRFRSRTGEGQPRTRRTPDQRTCHFARGVRAPGRGRSLGSGSPGFDRCIVAGGASESGVHRGARADRRPCIARHHHRGKSRHEREPVDHAGFR